MTFTSLHCASLFLLGFQKVAIIYICWSCSHTVNTNAFRQNKFTTRAGELSFEYISDALPALFRTKLWNFIMFDIYIMTEGTGIFQSAEEEVLLHIHTYNKILQVYIWSFCTLCIRPVLQVLLYFCTQVNKSVRKNSNFDKTKGRWLLKGKHFSQKASSLPKPTLTLHCSHATVHIKKYAKNLSRSKKKLAQELTNLRERTREGRTREKAVNAQISSWHRWRFKASQHLFSVSIRCLFKWFVHICSFTLKII